MAVHAVKRQKVRKKAVKSTAAKKVVNEAATNTRDELGARIVILTGDPRRKVVIVPGCHIDSMGQQDNVYFFEDGDALVGMIVEGGTVEYRAADRTYVVHLTDGRHSAE